MREGRTLNERLKKLRKALNIKQGEFAERISTTQGHVSDIENGRKELSDRTIKLICFEFSINEAWLRTGEGEMFQKEPETILGNIADTYNLDDFDIKIVEQYIKLKPSERGVIKEFLSNLSANDEIAVTKAGCYYPSKEAIAEMAAETANEYSTQK